MSGFCVVIQTGPGDDRYCDTFQSAERLAAALTRERDTGRGTTWCSIHGPVTSKTVGAAIAHVRLDALGRIWTDLTPDGARLI